MKIGINLLFLKPWLAGGTETYTRGLLTALAKNSDKTNLYYVFCSSELDTGFLANIPNFKIVRFYRVSRSLAYRYFFEQTIFPFKLKKYKLDILHSLGYIGPVFKKNHLVTIHDTNAFSHKNAMPLFKRWLLSFFLRVIARNSKHIIAVSNFSKQEIIKHLKAPASKITVIYEACKFDITPGGQLQLPTRYSQLSDSTYFAALTSTSPHKNIQTLITAFKQVQGTNTSIKLVLIGHMPADNSIQHYINEQQLNDKIIVTGFVDDSTLMSLLRNALCFVFPSLYEGFGLPLLEAQKMGVPVISSDMGSLPEIGAESAMYFRATSASDLAEKMSGMILNKDERLLYIKKGWDNVKRFSWEKTAEETLELYRCM